eukprot:m.25421 g.25421  ORF g.25421 m.25421 type:complete len:220 (+) comp8706_c0_seq1:73-732(+)
MGCSVSSLGNAIQTDDGMYLPVQEWRDLVGSVTNHHSKVSLHVRLFFNQQAIFQKLTGKENVDGLPYPPPEEWNRFVADGATAIGGQGIGSPVAIMTRRFFNQAAIFSKLTGEALNALPYPPQEEWRKWAGDGEGPAVIGGKGIGSPLSIQVKFAFNQQAIFRKLCGDDIKELPYPPPEEWRRFTQPSGGTLGTPVAYHTCHFFNQVATFNMIKESSIQ